MKKIKWNKKLAEDLMLKLQATNQTPNKLFKNRTDLPDGFEIEAIFTLIKCETKTVSKNYINYIYTVCKQEAKSGNYKRQQKGEPIPDDMKQKLLAEQKRTGLKLAKLLTLAGLTRINPEKMMQTVYGHIIKGKLDDFEAVLNAYATQEDKVVEPKIETLKRSYEPISQSKLQKLKVLRKIGLLPSRILKLNENTPDDLKPHMISSWFSKKEVMVNPQHLNWVLHTAECILNSTLDLLKK